ncbi:MAG: transcriptional regulator, partial [Bacteroidetes bacterium]
EGIVYKRVFQRKISDGNIFLRLVSDNVMYEPYEVSASDVREVWKAKTFILNEMPVTTESLSMDKLYRMVRDLQDQVSRIKGK